MSTTSRYLNITSQGLHAALKRVEDFRSRGNLVANSQPLAEQVELGEAGKRVQ